MVGLTKILTNLDETGIGLILDIVPYEAYVVGGSCTYARADCQGGFDCRERPVGSTVGGYPLVAIRVQDTVVPRGE